MNEKRRYTRREASNKDELVELNLLVEQYHGDIRQLEDKLKAAREKQRLLTQRHLHARRKKRAQQEIRRMDSTDVMLKFDELETRIDRMEGEADLVNFGKKSPLEEQLDKLTEDDEIEAALQALKKPPAAE